jgi:hypothetical protein
VKPSIHAGYPGGVTDDAIPAAVRRLDTTRIADEEAAWSVRYRACGLLAYSLRADALPELEPLLGHRDQRTVEDARAAIDAIRSHNHHFFVDRGHSGRSFWEVNKGDL